jgi:two-component system phosphate regulon response regulator PhoB
VNGIDPADGPSAQRSDDAVPPTRVFIVEDEPEIADLIRFHVEREGFEALVIASGKEALAIIERDPPDAVLLDLMLPDVDGLEICRRLRYDSRTREIPILMVTAKGEETDVVTGIELGADDYVTKPFSPKVLMARLRNVLRRRRPDAVPETPDEAGRLRLAGGAVVIDTDRHTVTAADRPVDLTVTEFGILRYLATRPGFVRTRDQIIAAVHGGNTVLSRRTVDVHVTALRRKLEDHGPLIETVRGVGYRLAESLPAPVGED